MHTTNNATLNVLELCDSHVPTCFTGSEACATKHQWCVDQRCVRTRWFYWQSFTSPLSDMPVLLNMTLFALASH
eukprot:6154946-Amphidinium_carterae.1